MQVWLQQAGSRKMRPWRYKPHPQCFRRTDTTGMVNMQSCRRLAALTQSPDRSARIAANGQA
eukprot:750391-Pelagomonas_calceolata.AAC.2